MSQYPERLLFAAAAMLVVTGLVACSKTPQALTSKPAAASEAANVSDVDITEHVQTALRQAPLLQGANIAVVTQKGDVRLTGQLADQAQMDEAVRIAHAAEGAHTVHNELTIKP